MFGLTTFGYIGWGLFILVLIIFIVQQQRHINFRMSLSAYAKWLLLDDETRNGQKHNFIDFIKNGNFQDATQMFHVCDRAVEEMATALKRDGSLIVVDKLMKEYAGIENQS